MATVAVPGDCIFIACSCCLFYLVLPCCYLETKLAQNCVFASKVWCVLQIQKQSGNCVEKYPRMTKCSVSRHDSFPLCLSFGENQWVGMGQPVQGQCPRASTRLVWAKYGQAHAHTQLLHCLVWTCLLGIVNRLKFLLDLFEKCLSDLSSASVSVWFAMVKFLIMSLEFKV